MKKITAAILGLSLLMPTTAKAHSNQDAVIAGAVVLGIAGIIAAQAERNRHRDRHYHHYYAPPVHQHPPRLIYREYPTYPPHYHHHPHCYPYCR